MRATPVVYIILAVLLVLSLGCLCVAEDSDRESQIVPALSAQFESVFYSKATFLSSSDSHTWLSQPEASNLRFPFAYLQGALESLRVGASSDLLEASNGVFVGARDFQPPAGLGAVRSRRCYVVRLADINQYELRKDFQGDPIKGASGEAVWTWSAKLAEFGEKDPKPSTLFATQVGHAFVLVSNDLGELRTLRDRMASAKDTPSDSGGVCEWDAFRRHEVWACRRYRRESGKW